MKLQTTLLFTLILASHVAVAESKASHMAGDMGMEPKNCHENAHNEGMGPSMMGDSPERFKQMADQLKLMPDQREAIKKATDQSRPQMQALAEKMRTNHAQLDKLMESDSADETQVRKLAQERGNLTADMMVLRMQIAKGIEKLLTPVQREQMKQMRNKHEHRHEHKV